MSRVKAKLIAFDGEVMTLEPLAPKGDAPKTGMPQAGVPFTVSIQPDTRYVSADRASLDGVGPGAYAGAAVTEGRGGSLSATDIYLYAEALRGSGEGRFPEAGRLIVNGTVSAVQPPAPGGAGSLTLHYRGAVLSGLGRGKTLCEGRASPPAYASALACQGDAVIQLLSATPVSALSMGDKSLLVPGSLVTVAMTKSTDDKNVTPGVIVEKPVAAATVEKPQSSP
ncbi:MAG TPA: hypothetical protein VJM79_07855 [Rhizorhapis sp.]|nr:hypothetical protein [Rhizorhapis sp.]